MKVIVLSKGFLVDFFFIQEPNLRMVHLIALDRKATN